MRGSAPHPAERRLAIIGMKGHIIIKALLLRLGLDAEKFLNCVQTAEYRVLIEIQERWIQPLSWASRTWNLVQNDRSLSMSIMRRGKSIVDTILHLLAA